MRVIAGSLKGRRLKAPDWDGLRPTSDKLRETLFNILAPRIAGARVVDAYAGTGAVGIEALSRGAFDVIFIENHPPAAKLIRHNLDSLGIDFGATVLAVDALHGLELLSSRQKSRAIPIEYVFIDPPYASASDYTRVLDFLDAAPFLAPGAIIIVEHRKNFDLPGQFGSLRRARVLKQGDAVLSFFSFGS